MRYSTPTIFFKRFQYYWKGANSKGHGVHSPFVFKFIRECLNVSSAQQSIENITPEFKLLLEEIDAVSTISLPEKIKKMLVRLVDQLKPVYTCVIAGGAKPADCTKSERIDFVFLGEGTSTATILHNSGLLLDRMHLDAWMIVEGIHVSAEMEAAWEELKKHPKIRLSIDLFSVGILFCRKEQKERTHFIIRY